MAAHAEFENGNKVRIHKFVIIWDIETDDAFAVKVASKALLDFSSMRPFHHENGVGPLHQFRIKRDFRVMVRPSRCNFNVAATGKYLLGSRASQPVLAANE